MPDGNQPERPGPATEVTRDSQQRASIAQLLLVARLKARTRRDLAVDSLDRAAHVMFVTCKNWFSAARPHDVDAGADAPTDGASASAPDRNNKVNDAHRHH